jgi:flagellar hook protein FlgE
MLRALSAAVSGLRTNQAALDVIGNNIANVNTLGFKASQAEFADLLSQTIAGEQAPSSGVGGKDAMQVGLGATLGAIRTLFTQGVIQSTNNPSDLAIQGEGFFVVKNGTDTLYTRAGAFTLDAAGTLVDGVTGDRLQGAYGDIVISPGSMIPGSPSTTEVFGGNLDASQADGTTHVVTFSVNDSLGTAHTVALTFTKAFATTPGEWTWAAATTDPNITGLTGATGAVTFDTTGALTGTTTASLGVAFAAAAGVATPQAVTLDFGSASNAAPLTGNAANSTASLTSQDGFAAGTLRQWSIGSDGSINASYDNGRNAVIDTIQLATFDNPGGLLHSGQNMFTISANSGIPHIGNPGTGGAGTLLPGALEGSNVDLAKQFTDLITAQRGFEASARVIRVGDEVLQTVVNIKQ